MRVTRMVKGMTDVLVRLDDVQLKPGSGNVFRLQRTSFGKALVGQDEQYFYMVINSTPEEPGRVTIASLNGKIVLKKDGSHLVHAHRATIAVDDIPIG